MNRAAEIKIFKMRLENIIKDLNNLIQKLKNECDKYQEGRLYIKYRGDKVHFVEYRNGKQMGISKNQDRIYELSRLEYLNSTIKILEELSDKTQEVISKMDSDNYEDALLHIMEKYKMLDFNRICFPCEKLQWNEASYNKNPYRTEFLRYGTKKELICVPSQKEQSEINLRSGIFLIDMRRPLKLMGKHFILILQF